VAAENLTSGEWLPESLLRKGSKNGPPYKDPLILTVSTALLLLKGIT